MQLLVVGPLYMKPEITQFLTDGGWRKYPCHFGGATELWCKRWPDAPRCACNSEKDGIQVGVTVYEHESWTSFEVDLTAEKPDGVWVKLQAYAIGEELPEVLNAQAEQLVAAWTAIHDASKLSRA